MCRIDAPFGDRSLDEKIEPRDRFIQALDEAGVSDEFRSLLQSHFADCWQSEFRNMELLEQGLGKARLGSTVAEEALAFFSTPAVAKHLLCKVSAIFTNDTFGPESRSWQLLEFVSHISEKYFGNSLFRIHQTLSASRECAPGRVSYYNFVSVVRRSSAWFETGFFNDADLASLGSEARVETLWGFYLDLVEWHTTGPEEPEPSTDAAPYETMALAAKSCAGSVGKYTANGIREGFEFLRLWIKTDARAGRILEHRQLLLKKIDEHFAELEKALGELPTESGSSGAQGGEGQENDNASARERLAEIKQELHQLFYRHADLSSLDDEQRFEWLLKAGMDAQPHPEMDARTVRTLIRWAIEQDCQAPPDRKLEIVSIMGTIFAHSEKWWSEDYQGTWQDQFTEYLGELDPEQRLRVLQGKSVPHDSAINEGTFREWWLALLAGLPDDPQFPKSLYPRWTLALYHQKRNDWSQHAPHVGKSIGLLRGQLSKGSDPDVHEQLKRLLAILDLHEPESALKQRLQLLRVSTIPLSDENISPTTSMQDDLEAVWFQRLPEIAAQYFAYCSNRRNMSRPREEEYDHQEQLDFQRGWYEDFCRQVADFFLSRLQLRKGQKPSGDAYQSDQAIEASKHWRQGYLKALSELGLDPNGKVHKTAHFIRQHDPDEDVRAIAKECYRSVRRDRDKSKKNLEDMKRALIAAEWWLLMAQRNHLGEPINHEEALKTRRRMMRRP